MGVQNKHCCALVELHFVCSWPDLQRSALQKTRLWDCCCCARLDLYYREEEAAFLGVCVSLSVVSKRV